MAAGQTDPIIDTFKLVVDTQRQISEVSRQAKNLVKAGFRSPEALAFFVEQQGTPVYQLHGGVLASILLFSLGYDQGFIPPSDTRQYRMLVKLLKMQEAKPHCNFKFGVFVVGKPLYTVGFLTHQLHHWLAYRSGMAGYNEKAQALYKRFWEKHHGVVEPDVLDMSIEEVCLLKEAINRDLEALQFLRHIVHEVLRPASQRGKFAMGHASA